MVKGIYIRFITLLVFTINSAQAAFVCKKSEELKHPKPHLAKKLKKDAEKKDMDSEDDSSSPVSGTFDITSNYLFRGISQTNNTAAFQGGLTYTVKKTGIHFDVWGSNVYMPIPDRSTTATIEIDFGAGIANAINDHLSYDIHLLRYSYPKASYFQYNELIGSLTYRFLTGLIGYSNNVFNSDSTGTYYNLAVSFDIPPRYIYFNDVTLNGSMGYYSLSKRAGNSYKDYSLSLNKKIKHYTLTVQWTDTDHKLLDNSLDHSQLIGMVTATF